MKTTSIFFIIIFCMTSPLIGSFFDEDIDKVATTIVDMARNALYSIKRDLVGPTAEQLNNRPKEASVCLLYRDTYTQKQLDSEATKEVFDTLSADITMELMKERLNTHTQFLKAYHAQHPYVLYGIGFVCTVSIAHSLYTVINKIRKKQT